MTKSLDFAVYRTDQTAWCPATAQAVELVRALRHQLREMTAKLAWVERQDVTRRNGRACTMRLEAAALRRDIQKAQVHIDQLQRRYLSGDQRTQQHPAGGQSRSMVDLYPVMLDSFSCTAKELAHYRLKSWSMWLRLEGDSDDPGTWHLVKSIRDTGLQGVKLLTVSFLDETPELVLNQFDQVEFAVPRPLHLPES